MIAIDANVAVRLVMEDDPEQAQRVRAILEANQVVLLPGVLLETVWVLESVYGLQPSHIAQGLRRVCGLPSVVAEDPQALETVFAAYEKGADFADALHVCEACACGAEAFVTFDKALVRRAKREAWAGIVREI